MAGVRAAFIRFSDISKSFPGVRALHKVCIDIRRGDCHALLGENGAGKSTLGKILAGIYQPDDGRVELDGHAVAFRSPRDARLAGIGMVHQELAFCENLSVAENLCLSDLPRRGPFVSRARLLAQASDMLRAIDADVDPSALVGDLSISHQQLVQIAGAVAGGARILVFDEPTSSLSQVESQRLFKLIRSLKDRGVTSIYVSHRLREIFDLCDAVTVLRDGEVVDTRPIAGLDEGALVRMMIGRSLDAYFPAHSAGRDAPERLRVELLESPGKFQPLSFSVRAGEIVGMAGLVGAGRTEVTEALFGLDPRSAGRILVEGKPAAIRSPRDAMRYGLGLVPEDRKRHGLVLSMGSGENISLAILDRLCRLGWINARAEAAEAGAYVERLRIRAPSLDTPAGALSGGNQQKLVMAKWLAAHCRVLLVDEPTRGVDVGAKAEIHALLSELARAGSAILLVSSELPEVLNLSDRILVMRAGQLVGEVDRASATQESVLRLMAGVA